MKKVYSISYDLHKPGQNYSSLHDAIKKFDNLHVLESQWLVYTDLNPEGIYNQLHPYIDKNDHILINEFSSNYYGYLPKDYWTWIKNRVPVKQESYLRF